MSDADLTVLDLFCGIGGASSGIQSAGLDVVAAVDNDTTALQVYETNLPAHHTVEHDLHTVDPSVIPADTVDWVHASAPCKGYTYAGNQDTADHRNSLLFDALDWIRAVDPTYVTLENVVGLLHMDTPDGTEVTTAVASGLQSLGYDTHHTVLNAADYGVPQKRKRVFFFACPAEAAPAAGLVPTPTHAGPTADTTSETRSEWVSVAETLAQYDAVAGTRTIDDESKIGIGQSYYPIHPDEPSYTVTGSNGMGPGIYVDGETCRRFSPEECALLQALHDYDLSSLTRSDAYDYVGNAVPPRLQRCVADSIADHATRHA